MDKTTFEELSKDLQEDLDALVMLHSQFMTPGQFIANTQTFLAVLALNCAPNIEEAKSHLRAGIDIAVELFINSRKGKSNDE